MCVQKIRSIINQAEQEEEQGEYLKTWISNTMGNIHQAIELPNENAVDALTAFITAYVRHVPEFLNIIQSAARESGLDKTLWPILHLVENYFTNPPERRTRSQGLEKLVDEAYLAHRVFEELNDQFCRHTGIPLIPVDLTTANLIVHSIIGERFANQLDELVHISIHSVLDDDEEVFESDGFLNHMDEQEKYWDQGWHHWSESFHINRLNISFL